MNHRATPRFWRCYEALPEEIRRVADRSFDLLKRDPRHPSLHFKRIGRFRSVRIGLHHRALAVEAPADSATGLVWFWIGSHADYDRLVAGA